MNERNIEQPLRILHLEDNSSDRRLVALALASAGLACHFVYAETEAEFRAALAQKDVGLILADFALPGYDGLAALALAREQRPDVPILFCSGHLGEEQAIESLKAGATDYVLKHRLDRLGPAVRRALREVSARRAQQEAEAALRDSEERFRILFEYAPDACYLNDLEARLVYGNRAAEELVGYRRAELIGKSLLELNLLDPTELPRAGAALARNAQGQPTGPEEYTLRRKDGRRVQVEIRSYPVQLRGQVLVLAIARDITARKQAEEELRTSEERFRSIWEHSLDGMRLTDRAGRIVALNEAYCRLVRLPRAKLLGQVFSVTYAGHGSDDGLEVYRQRFETGNLVPRWTARALLWNGEELDLEISGSFIEAGAQGRLVLCIFRDVTERKRMELQSAAFSQLGQRLSAARTAREAGEIIFEAADQLLGWDAGALDLYSAAEDKLQHVLNFDTINGQRVAVDPGRHSPAPSPFARRVLLLGGQLILKAKPQEPLPGGLPFGDLTRPSAALLFVPVRRGTEVNGLLSIQSYTPQAYDQQSLETLQALADHCAGALERIRIQEALLAAQQQLRQVQKMEAIGQLAGGIAHDFNNLLLVMRGNADLLLMGPGHLSEAAREGLTQITAAAERAANLTRQLLAFSRKQVIQPQALRLNEIIANLAKMLKRIIGEHIDLQCAYCSALPFVQADPGMMEQVLVNLAVNARDAMPRGGQLHIVTEAVKIGEARVLANPEARVGEFACLLVRDTGTGIAPEHLPRIFEPFFTTKEAGKGTGLGLATVYGVVKQHQGWVEVTSQVGEGTSFRIFLPAIPAPPATAPITRTEPAPRGGTETILLVEDDASVRLVTQRVLESAGYKVLSAASVPEAVALWNTQRETVALLLTDLVMSKTSSGRDLAEQLRARQPALKVILLTGYALESGGKDPDIFGSGRLVVLQKPCSALRLLETVRRCLDEP